MGGSFAGVDAPIAREQVEDLDDHEPPKTEEQLEAIAQAWYAESARRLADLRAGRTMPVPWDSAMAEIKARLASR